MNFQKDLIDAGFKSLILLQNEIGAGRPGAGAGAQVLAKELLKNQDNTEVTWSKSTILKRDDSRFLEFPAKYIDHMEQIATENAALVEEGLKRDRCLVLSGDHSNAFGSVLGLVKAFPNARIGVIWIDAHADLHTPFTTPSGNFHGMPLGALLGIESKGKNSESVSDVQAQMWHQYLMVSGKKPAIVPSDLVYIAVRSSEYEEDAVITDMNILKIEVPEIRAVGVETVILKTLQHLEHCNFIYVSFDIDSLDASLVSGTGTPVAGGLMVDEATKLLRGFVHHPKTKVFEITEVNPSLDLEPQSVIESATDIIHQVFKK